MPISINNAKYRVLVFRYVLFAVICLSLLSFQVALADDYKRLNILLTNDDGYDAVGMQTLKDALRVAGHNVTVVAPTTERSGSGAAIDFAPLRFEQVGAQDWKIDATPATCVFVALSVLLDELPDLVISGTNIGNNVGAIAPFSGTVGATIAALNAHLVGAPQPLPAIAISADWPVGEQEDREVFRQHYVQVAQFAVELVDALFMDVEVTFPSGVSLNVNYPGLAKEDIKGVVLTTQGRSLDYSLRYKQATLAAQTVLVAEIIEVDADVLDLQGSDVAAFREGYITITLLDGDYAAARRLSNRAHLALEAMTP